MRTLGRNIRAGCADADDEDAFVRIRLAYEGAADRLPDVAWPWYRLAELLAWAGFAERALDHYAQAERRSLGSRDDIRTSRPLLRAMVATLPAGNYSAGVSGGAGLVLIEVYELP